MDEPTVEEKYKDIDIITGDITTIEAVVDLIEAVSDAVKVGMGSG